MGYAPKVLKRERDMIGREVVITDRCPLAKLRGRRGVVALVMRTKDVSIRFADGTSAPAMSKIYFDFI